MADEKTIEERIAALEARCDRFAGRIGYLLEASTPPLLFIDSMAGREGGFLAEIAKQIRANLDATEDVPDRTRKAVLEQVEYLEEFSQSRAPATEPPSGE